MLLYKGGLINALNADNITREEPFDFANNTTYGLGGLSPCAYYPKTIYEACKVAQFLRNTKREYVVLGNGSNVLVSDNGYSGCVISTKLMRGIIKISDTELMCLAGTKVSELLSYCKTHGLGGLEYLYGIPASMGGVAYMNAGVGKVSVSENIKSVLIFDEKKRILSNKNCNFGYRQSTMRDINALILAIIVKVDRCSREQIDEKINYYKQRRSHLPKGRSCGCVFKNPQGISAGLLIDSAGLKGERIGGARVSERHADFILNEGASASDVRRLIELVKMRVFVKFGVLLQEEVVYIGEFNDFNC